MFEINEEFKSLNNRLTELTTNISTIEVHSVQIAIDKAYSEINKWIKIKDCVVVFSDLKNSTEISVEKQSRTMTKVLESINFPFITIHNKFGAEYIDMKGDGGIAIYSKYNYIKAILASVTLESFYRKNVQSKFNIDFIVKTGIARGDLLVKKIGNRKENGKFYVWAGEIINKAALISKTIKNKPNEIYLGVTQDIFESLESSEFKSYLYDSCGCPSGKTESLWKSESLQHYSGKKYYYVSNSWCDKHGQDYINKIFELLKSKEKAL